MSLVTVRRASRPSLWTGETPVLPNDHGGDVAVMYIVNAQEAGRSAVTTEGAVDTQIQWLLDASRGAPNFALRRFIIAPGGHTPRHTHNWEHEVYVLRGQGLLITKRGEIAIGPDQAILILPNEEHQFCCTGSESLEMLCVVPNGPATVGH